MWRYDIENDVQSIPDITPRPVQEEEHPPQAEPVEQSIHAVRERQFFKRRLFLNRLVTGSIVTLLAGAGGIAGTFTTMQQREQVTLQAMQRENKRERDTVVQNAHKQGLAQGHVQGTRELAASLEKLNGVTPGQANNSAGVLQSLYDVFIVPLAASPTSIADMLNSLELSRRIIVAAGDDTSAIDSLIAVLQAWQNNTSELVKPLADIQKSDTDMAASYLTTLLATLARSH